ncbi:MAG TPA: beta-galactosidase [Planctomycetota bacterium]|nr:beta-galactosidase [Planctomycetota bacterium]
MTAAAPFVRLAPLLAFALATAAGGDEDDARAAAWKRFPVFVWFHGGPPAGPAAFEVLRRHGLLGCNVEGSDSSDAAARAGVPFYADHVAGKGDLYLRPAEFEKDQKRLAEELLAFRPVRPNCFVAEEVVARLDRRVDENARRQAPNRPLAYVLDDELSVTRGVNPMDYCFGPECLAGLRHWLIARDGSLEKVNAAWGTRFSSVDAIVPPTTEAARVANAERPLAQLSFAAWSDHREFMDEALALRLDELAERVRRVDPGAPVGFTGGQLPSAFGGFDWGRLLRTQTFVEPYEGGLAPALVHGLARPGTKVVSTWFVPDEADARAKYSPWEVFPRVARGDDGAVIWSSGAIFEVETGGEHGSELDLNAAGRALAEVVAAARALRAATEGAQRPRADVAIVVSQPSIRATWLVDSWGDGKTWPRRLTSYESDHSSSAAARLGWDAVCGALGLEVGYVDVRELSGGAPAAAPADGPRIWIVPEGAALSEREIDALLAKARAGALVVADAHALLFDERLRGRDDAALRRLFGVRRAPGRKLADLARELASGSLAVEGDALTADGAERNAFAGFVKSHGTGATWLLDRRLAGLERAPERLAQFAAGFEQELAARGRSPKRTRPALAAAGRVRWRRLEEGVCAWWIGVRIDGDGASRGEAVEARLDFAEPRRVQERLGRPLDPAAFSSDAPVAGVAARIDASHPLLLRCEPR